MSDGDKLQDKAEAEIEALVRSPERPLTEAPQRPAGISAPAEQSGVNYLVMNVVIPGLGSLLAGNKSTGAAQLGLAVAGLLMFITGHFLLGLALGFGGWAWSVVSGFGFLGKKKSAW